MVIPIGDQNRPGAPVPYVTYAIVALNALVFIYMLTLSTTRLESFVLTYGAVPANIAHGEGLITLLTSTFIHGGWLHIIGNMIFLWVFGDNIEAALGHWIYLAFYLVAGVLAGLSQVVVDLQSTIPSIGASGAIAGVMGCYAILFPAREVRVLIIAVVTRVSALVFLGVWALLQFFNGLLALRVQTAQTGGVAVWAHVGGFAFGVVVGLIAHEEHRETRG